VPLDGVAIEREGFCVVNLAEFKAFVKDAQPKKFIEIESDDVAVKAATDINGNSINQKSCLSLFMSNALYTRLRC
jgi:hypothetical protein